jgi:phospholipid-transporting ATPase
MQAVQTADFAIGEFQCLHKLLFVHGRQNYIRISNMILYFFYKNMLFTMPQFFYAFQCAVSGQTTFDAYYISGYNMAFTAFPLIVTATLDWDIYYKKIIVKLFILLLGLVFNFRKPNKAARKLLTKFSKTFIPNSIMWDN